DRADARAGGRGVSQGGAPSPSTGREADQAPEPPALRSGGQPRACTSRRANVSSLALVFDPLRSLAPWIRHAGLLDSGAAATSTCPSERHGSVGSERTAWRERPCPVTKYSRW